MLPPDQRHVLLDLLRPPPGYELDRAVGTTFTLDLETALVLPLAFASYRLARSNDPIALMEAVRSAASRVDLFCQAGQMVVRLLGADGPRGPPPPPGPSIPPKAVVPALHC